MDAHLFVDVNCPRNCRRSRARHSNRNRSRPSVRKNGRSLEPLQRQIPRISLRSRYGLHGVFWCSIFRESASCCRLSAYPDLDWFLAHLSRGALFVRCCVRCNPWNSFCRSCSARVFAANQRSPIETRNLDGGGGEIRTHEAFRPSGFQDRRDQPLCHPSTKSSVQDCAIAQALSKEA